MKKTLSMILCVLMLASCLSLCAFAEEETTAESTEAEVVEHTNDRIVFDGDLSVKPNCLTSSNGMNKSSGVSKKGEWEGYKINIKSPEDPNFGFNYTSYCQKYDLTPLTGEEAAYIVLKVLVPEDGFYDDFEIFYCAGSITNPTQDAAATSEYCDEANGYAYFIYNLDGAWSGDINMIRFDPVGLDEGDILYLMEMAMFKTEEEAIAWCGFEEEETEATTEKQTEEPTTEQVTEEETTKAPSARPSQNDKKNCNSVIGIGAFVAIISLGIVCLKKKGE